MFNYGMTVEDVGTCVRLIDVMTRNLPALGIERSNFDAVHIASDRPAVTVRVLGEGPAEHARPVRRRYTLMLSGIPDTTIADLERLAGAKLREVNERPPTDQTISINELLESVLLVRESRPTAANGLVLALLGTDPGNVDLARWYVELSRLGCRGVRIGCVAGAGEEIRVLYLIEIARPPPNFVPPAEWEANRVFVFHRLKPEVSCPIYIEWGYAHPVRELARLYQINDERLVLMAADVLEQRRGQAGRPQTRVCLKLRSRDWRTIFEMPDQAEYAIELATELELQNLEPAAQPINVTVAVDVRSRPLVGSSLGEVEHKIALHQQAIEQLHRARQHHDIERQEPVYLVRVFEQHQSQDAGEGPPALPTGFVRFLDRPYTELAGFQYGYFEDPFRSGTWLHAVLDERPGAYERIVTDMASDAYVCPQRWWDLGVRLFVRASDTLHPYLEDDALLLRLRDELWERGGFDHEHPILIRRDPHGAGAAQAICLSQLSQLLAPGVFRLLSTRFDVRAPEFHLGTRDDMLDAQQTSLRTLNDLAATLEAGVEAAIAERVDAVEAAWKNADARMQETETRLAAHVASAAEINALLDAHSASWEAFVGNVLEADRSLAHRKLEALANYEAARDKHAKAVQLYERGVTDVNKLLERDRQEVTTRRGVLGEHEARLAKFEQELPPAIVALDKYARQLGARLDEFGARQVQSFEDQRDKIAILEKKFGDAQYQLKAIGEDHRRAEELQAAEMRALKELDRLRERFESQDKIQAVEKAALVPPLDDAFLEWLKDQTRNGVEERQRAQGLLAWLSKELAGRRP